MMPNYTKKETKIIDMYLEEVAPKWVKFDPDTETFYLLPNAPDDIKKKFDQYMHTIQQIHSWGVNFNY